VSLEKKARGTGKTVAQICEAKKLSDRTVRVALKGVKPVGYRTIYHNRKAAIYSAEQVAAAFPKKTKK
jgi:hypothetical protein